MLIDAFPYLQLMDIYQRIAGGSGKQRCVEKVIHSADEMYSAPQVQTFVDVCGQNEVILRVKYRFLLFRSISVFTSLERINDWKELHSYLESKVASKQSHLTDVEKSMLQVLRDLYYQSRNLSLQGLVALNSEQDVCTIS